MCQKMLVLLLCLISLGILEHSAADLATANAEENMVSLRFSYIQLENKLERHESRERALGEVIKRSLQSLQRGQHNLQLLYGSQTSLDGRFSQIEDHLKTQEERFSSRFEKFFTEQNQNHQQLLEKIMKLSINVEKLLYNSNYVLKPSQRSYSNNPYTELLMSRWERVAPVKSPEVDNSSQVQLEERVTDGQELCAQSQPQEGLTNADKEFIRELASETHSLVERVNTNMQSMVQTTQAESTSPYREVGQSINVDNDLILKRFNTQEELMQKLYYEMNSCCLKVNDNLENLSRCNSISQPLTQAMDTEASINNIQVNDKQLFDFLKAHFDAVDKNITNMQLEIAKNVNSTIQNEATYLWRQISITNGEINQSRDLLRLMRDRNDIYVNSVLQSMASMSNKVEDMKERIMDVNDNQNYLLKKLPLMSQEFTDMQQAFIGLLEQLSETLKIVQEKKKVPTS